MRWEEVNIIQQGGNYGYAEREGIDTILTFDRRDFKVYRAAGIGALKILPKP